MSHGQRVDVVELVTKEVADQWLTKNHPRNRHVQQAKVEEFKEILRQNKWEETNQGVAFDEDGWLVDGQKRLMAISETGIAVRILVSRNLPRSAFKAIDRGQKRDDADVLYMDGLDVDREDVSTAKTMIGSVDGPRVRSNTEYVGEFMRRHEVALSWSKQNLPKRKINTTVRAVVTRAFYTANLSRLDEFCKVMVKNEVSSNGDGAAVLLIRRISQKDWNTWDGRRELYLLVERALDAFMRYESLSVLAMPKQPAERFPLPEDMTEGQRRQYGYDEHGRKIITPED